MLHRGSENHWDFNLFALKCIEDILLGVAVVIRNVLFFNSKDKGCYNGGKI